MHKKQISSTKLNTAKRIVIEANERVQGLNNQKQQTTGGLSQRGSSRVNTARNTNDGDTQPTNTAIYVAKEYLKSPKTGTKN